MSKKASTIELYQSRGQWRWRMRDYRNRKIIAASSESYRRRIDAVRNLQRVSHVGWQGAWGISGDRHEASYVVRFGP